MSHENLFKIQMEDSGRGFNDSENKITVFLTIKKGMGGIP